MLISYRKKFIFIHIYKTAGTSVTNALLPYARIRDRLVYDFWLTQKLCGRLMILMGWEDDGWKQFTGYHKHATADAIRRKMGEHEYDRYFKFVFVRNPYDLLVSLYFYIREHREHRLYKVASTVDFSDFVKRYVASSPEKQTDFIYDPQTGSSLVNYVGRVETLRDDLEQISKALSLPDLADEVGYDNPSLLREHKDYRSYYDEETRFLVSDFFKRDLDDLGYCFDGIVSK